MKFRDAIASVAIITTTTEEIQSFGKVGYSKDSSYDYSVEVTYKNASKYSCVKESEEELNVFIDTLVKLSHYCEYEFDSIEAVYEFVDGIAYRVWWDRYDSIDYICSFITDVTGLHFEDYLK